MKKVPLTRLLDAYETAAVEVQQDGSALIFVESQSPDLLLATLAVPAEALDRLDLRPFPDAKLKRRAYMLKRMRELRQDPAYRERERRQNRKRMRAARKPAGG